MQPHHSPGWFHWASAFVWLDGFHEKNLFRTRNSSLNWIYMVTVAFVVAVFGSVVIRFFIFILYKWNPHYNNPFISEIKPSGINSNNHEFNMHFENHNTDILFHGMIACGNEPKLIQNFSIASISCSVIPMPSHPRSML